jgi:hypothetical protein
MILILVGFETPPAREWFPHCGMVQAVPVVTVKFELK